MLREYLIVVESGEEGGYGAYCPDVDGVIAAAETRGECEALMREALEFHLEGLLADGEPVPASRCTSAYAVIDDA